MSSVGDLIELIRATNEIYLINPVYNIRSAYIQIDDICELVMKSYLQIADSNWTPIDHIQNGRDFFKGFRTITREVKQHFPEDSKVANLLIELENRRDNRNHFFHDHNQTGLTVDDKKCLEAFIDLYDLSFHLLGNEFITKLQANSVVQAQIAIIKLRLRGYQTTIASNNYQQVLSDGGPITLYANNFGYEFCFLYKDTTLFLKNLRQHFQELITIRENEINRIDALQKKNSEHRRKLRHLTEEASLFRNIIDNCLS